MRDPKVLVILSFLFSLASFSLADDPGVNAIPVRRRAGWLAGRHQEDPFVSKLRNEKVSRHSDEVQRTVGNYGRFAADLMEVFMSETVPESSKCTAAYLLGELRFAGAAGILTFNISLRGPKNPGAKCAVDYDTYPAAAALINIGKPAVAPLLDAIVHDFPDEVLRLCVVVLVKIEGKRCAVELVKERFNGGPDISRPENREKILQFLSEAE